MHSLKISSHFWSELLVHTRGAIKRNAAFLRSRMAGFSENRSWKCKYLHGSWPPTQLLSVTGLLTIEPTPNAPSLWLLLSIITGLPIALWSYKRKILYMGYLPPGARDEKLKDVPKMSLKGLEFREIYVQNMRDGVDLRGIYLQPKNSSSSSPQTIIFYLQGNAGNPLHRLPVFRTILQPGPPGLRTRPDPKSLSIVAFAPRSYWKSSSRTPTEAGLMFDYLSALRYTLDHFPTAQIILYGHSLGATIAVHLLSKLSADDDAKIQDPLLRDVRYTNIRGLILENAFPSIPEMLKELYSSHWLPYHYLGPLVRDKWDAYGALRGVNSVENVRSTSTVLDRLKPDTMVLVSENDELVPPEMGEMMWRAILESDLDRKHSVVGRKVVIEDALHENAWQQKQWLTEMRRYIADIQARSHTQTPCQ